MDIFVLLVIILIPRVSSAAFGFKVPSLLPESMELCLLRVINLPPLRMKIACSAICQLESSCLLACQRGTDCKLYKATVSPNWSQTTPEVPLQESGSCFSFWAERRDLAPSTHFTASSNHPDTVNTNGVNDGFSCPLVNNMFYHSVIETKPWVLGDLSSPKWVEKVAILTRGNIDNQDWLIYFTNVEVRVGNDKGTGGDFSLNELMMFHTGSDYDYEKIVTFKGERPLLGRYVSVQSLSFSTLAIMEMKIVEAP